MSYAILTGLLSVFPLPEEDRCAEVQFHYAYESPMFEELRAKYPIETVAGDGTDEARATRILSWFSEHCWHHGSRQLDVEKRALPLLEAAFDGGAERGITCRELSTALTEILLALGMKARTVFMLPCSPYDGDNHVVTEVYSRECEQWIILDPTWGSKILDDQGQPLGLLSMRNRLARQAPIQYSSGAHYHDRAVNEDDVRYLNEYYAKNSFCFALQESMGFGDDAPSQRGLTLAPEGYDDRLKTIANIDYRIRQYGDSEEMQRWKKEAHEQVIHYIGTSTFERG